jgi:SAM-dependent methyltransferase
MKDLREHFDWVADHCAITRRRQRAFHAQLAAAHRAAIPVGSRVLEVGCGLGELLAELRPAQGLGIDLSARMIERARAAHGARAELSFRHEAAESFVAEASYDHIVLNYLTGYLEDIQAVLVRLQEAAHARTRLHLTSLNTPWGFLVRWGVKLGWVMPQPPSNWLSEADLVNLLELAGWEVVKRETQQLLPVGVPGLSAWCNRLLVRLPLLRHLGATLWLTARPRRAVDLEAVPGCSVIVPARNEAGNIRAALERIPVLGRGTEVIFVEGHSRDDTWEVIQRELAAYQGPHEVRALRQPGKGKWDAVRAGFAVARGEVLVIQDGDLTAPPEDLPKFFEALRSGAAEFVNGSRLVYPMEKRAMRFLNLLGNKFFALALSYVLGQPVKDSLCGTKMLLRADYERLRQRIEVLGDFDPFGDFNLLFGASLLNLKIRDLPVRYADRTYGETNISRFRHGWILLKMTWFGLWNLRFPPARSTEGRDAQG